MLAELWHEKAKQLAAWCFELVVMLDGDKHAIIGQSVSQAEGRVACERAELEDAPRTNHPAEHTQQFALHLTGEHVRIDDMQVGVTSDTSQQFRLGSGA